MIKIIYKIIQLHKQRNTRRIHLFLFKSQKLVWVSEQTLDQKLAVRGSDLPIMTAIADDETPQKHIN